MAEEQLFASRQAVDYLQRRTLTNWFPTLQTYLSPGMSVLDVGCGPGTVTMDVAGHVTPGRVVGIDMVPGAIDSARSDAGQAGIANASFQVGDAHHLDFPDACFDLTYSIALLHYLSDPLGALRERVRVTKRGGWLVISEGDWGAKLLYPSCPALEKLIALAISMDNPAHGQFRFDFRTGRRGVAMLTEAGLIDIRVDICCPEIMLGYPGARGLEMVYRHFLAAFFPEPLRPVQSYQIETGLLDQATLDTARAELEAWRVHPHAFSMDLQIVVGGRVP